ncbi:MAG: hypothetical protein EON51_07145 [Acinetobacter sp.]|nr:MULTISPECIES: hypothetical protein [unclassified Acinetobacter]RZJ22482.1 MAG: hypothetical protein EON51_07145 [Acinetobacter sp.]
MNKILSHGEVFSIATLIYARLRRVSGRVIDAIYLAKNIEYAQHIVELAQETQDPELLRLISRLKTVLNLSSLDEPALENPIEENAELLVVEPTEDDIYRAQVSHHYIGALR